MAEARQTGKTPTQARLVVAGAGENRSFIFPRNPSKITRTVAPHYADVPIALANHSSSDTVALFEWVGNDPDDVLKSIAVVPYTLTLTAGSPTGQLEAIATFQSGRVQNVTTVATWASSDDTEATVSATGLVSRVVAGAPGTANVTATWLGVVSGACAVTTT